MTLTYIQGVTFENNLNTNNRSLCSLYQCGNWLCTNFALFHFFSPQVDELENVIKLTESIVILDVFCCRLRWSVQEHCKWCRNVIKKFSSAKGNPIFMIKMNLGLTKSGFYFFRQRNTISFSCQKKPFGREWEGRLHDVCCDYYYCTSLQNASEREGRKVDFPIWTRRQRPERAGGERIT